MPRWMRYLRAFWATVLILALLFSALMASWGSLREAVMLRVIADRHAKSFLLQFPAETRVWIGEELLGAAEMHRLAEDEPEGSDAATEGLPIRLPRVYLREDQILKHGVRPQPGESLSSLVQRLAPGAEILWHGEPDSAGFRPLLLGRDGRLDYALLCMLSVPNERQPLSAAFLLRAELEGTRVFRLSRHELWSDRLWAPPGEFWALRDEHDGFPPRITGQVKTVWRWFFELENDQENWQANHTPEPWSEAAWRDLTP
jgi:hypothetical protein